MRIKLPYSVKSYFELPLLEYEPVLSPYDRESIVLYGIALHPRITIAGVHGDTWVQSVEKCANPVFLNKDKYICNAVAGLSHDKHGVALFRHMKRYVVETGDGLKLTADEAIYAQAPGTVIVALYDSPWTHVVTSSYNGIIQVFEKAYKSKPVSAFTGYRSFSVVFQDGRSILIYENKVSEAGFPIEAVAYVNNIVLARSSGWLVWMEPDMPKPSILTKEEVDFVGFHQHLPVFKMHGKLYRLEGGALVDLNINTLPDALVTASDVVVLDSGDALTAYDVNLKQILNIPKEETTRCWAIESKIFCCTRGLCGVIEPGESFIYVEPVNSALKEAHVARVASETPIIAIHNNAEHMVKPGGTIEIVEENASILDPHLFNIEIHHLLGSTDVFVESRPSLIELDVDARGYVSTGIHLCGGLAFLELDVREIKAPSRVKILIENTEVKPGKHGVCINKTPLAVVPVAFDTVSRSRKTLGKVSVKLINIPEPSLDIDIEHGDGLSMLKIYSNAEHITAKLICRNGAIELSTPESTVRDCITPAHIEVELRSNGFIYRRRRDIVLKGLLDYVVHSTSTGIHEYREGGFIARYVIPPMPEVNPVSIFKLAIGLTSVDIRFKSKVIGRLVVYDGSSTKSYIVRPGQNTVSAGFSSTYYLVFDTGFNKYAYKLELPLQEQIKVAEKHALSLYNALKRWLK